MDELSEVETNDALLRNQEGGGPMPLSMQGQFVPLQNLAETDAKSPWYKNSTWLLLMGLAAAATIGVAWYATRRQENSGDPGFGHKNSSDVEDFGAF